MGGYGYFKGPAKERQLLSVNAISLAPSKTGLVLVGCRAQRGPAVIPNPPHPLSCASCPRVRSPRFENTSNRLYTRCPVDDAAAVLGAMEKQGRLVAIQDKTLKDAGFRKFGWAHSTEQFAGGPLSSSHACEHGAFIYQRDPAATRAIGAGIAESDQAEGAAGVEATLYALVVSSPPCTFHVPCECAWPSPTKIYVHAAGFGRSARGGEGAYCRTAPRWFPPPPSLTPTPHVHASFRFPHLILPITDSRTVPR